jgi:hypothetical protein
VGEAQGEVAVVAEEKGAAALSVEAADGMEAGSVPQPLRQQIQHRPPSVGVVAGAEGPRRLVEEKGEAGGRGAHRPAIDAHQVPLRIGPIPELGGAAIDLHPSLPQQVFPAATGTDAGGGKEFLEALSGHGPIFGPAGGEVGGRIDRRTE